VDLSIDADERRDYTWDCTARLEAGETITAATVTATACTLTTNTGSAAPADGCTHDDTTVTAWVHEAAERAAISAHITTSAGRIYDDTIALMLVRR
jgi:hypothetical protein